MYYSQKKWSVSYKLKWDLLCPLVYNQFLSFLYLYILSIWLIKSVIWSCDQLVNDDVKVFYIFNFCFIYWLLKDNSTMIVDLLNFPCQAFFFFFALCILRLCRQWHPTPVLLPGKAHGRRSLVGCSPWSR